MSIVSVIILTYNAQKYIKDCLESVQKQTYPEIEILIIDNNSQDKTKDFLKGLTPKANLKIFFNNQNTGFSAGQNQGIRESRGEFVLCLNQDVILAKNFIEAGLSLIGQNKKIGAVQGKLLRPVPKLAFGAGLRQPAKNTIDTTGLIMLKNRRIISRGQGQIDQNQYEETAEIFGADGATPLYRKQALEDAKINQEYFDEDFNMYKEDVDLAWRLRLFGWQIFYQPKAVAWHWRGSGDAATRAPWGIVRERRKISQFSKYLSFKNQRLTQIKNELPWLFFKHLPWIIPKEISAWLYVLIFEKYTWGAIKDLLKQAPAAWQKRKIIMAKKKIGAEEMKRWFE